MKKMAERLYLSAIRSERWRSNSGAQGIDNEEWGILRRRILERDNYTCHFCGFRSLKYMEVHHIGGDAQDNSINNLVTLCPLCHACLHIGFSGLMGRGSLVTTGTPLSQEEINRSALEACRVGGIGFAEHYLKTHIKIDMDAGSEGLVFLANDLISGSLRRAPEEMRFFPYIKKFKIAAYLTRNLSMDGPSPL